jgi:hypothetical protein
MIPDRCFNLAQTDINAFSLLSRSRGRGLSLAEAYLFKRENSRQNNKKAKPFHHGKLLPKKSKRQKCSKEWLNTSKK